MEKKRMAQQKGNIYGKPNDDIGTCQNRLMRFTNTHSINNIRMVLDSCPPGSWCERQGGFGRVVETALRRIGRCSMGGVDTGIPILHLIITSKGFTPEHVEVFIRKTNYFIGMSHLFEYYKEWLGDFKDVNVAIHMINVMHIQSKGKELVYPSFKEIRQQYLTSGVQAFVQSNLIPEITLMCLDYALDDETMVKWYSSGNLC
jgi:hypothetical protein